jgi:hypothetical protein
MNRDAASSRTAQRYEELPGGWCHVDLSCVYSLL